MILRNLKTIDMVSQESDMLRSDSCCDYYPGTLLF